MGRPSKTVANSNWHMTQEEKKQRLDAEKAIFSGIEIRESGAVSKDKVAHEEFLRVTEILTKVGKNDAMFEAVINDYCCYKSDIERYLKLRRKIERDKSMAGANYYKLLMDCDKQIEAYRKKRFDIEKETGFTLAAAMRTIPKKSESPQNPLLSVLNNGQP